MIESASVRVDHGGERMAPEWCAPATFWEHVYRYRFAAHFVRGRRVLDIASGEGYGTAALAAAGAGSVVGIDVSPEACEHARKKYRIDARVGRAESIPLPDRSVDAVVSFETIEHLQDPELFIRECHRVLAPGGTLIISTPNRPVYSPRGKHNEFHTCEMDEDEFRAVVASRFPRGDWYVQRPSWAPRWSPRVFGADGSPWSRFRVCRGLLRAVRLLLCPRIMGEPPAAWRAAPVRAVLSRQSRISVFANPYVVRKRTVGHDERPAYWVMVAPKLAA